MAKRLIPRHQVGKKLLNLLESFGNAQIVGDSGAGAYVAVSSGYLYNPKTKKWEYSKENLTKKYINELIELSWDPDDWFAYRTPKPDGTLYSEEDAAKLASHVPEYKSIEVKSKLNGTWLKMPDGSTWKGDPRVWVMMLSEAFKKNYSDRVWYTGLGEWKTTFDYPNNKNVITNKVTRAPYFNGLMWFSNDKSYADAFSYYYGVHGHGLRSDSTKGKTFIAAIPKEGNYRDLEPPSEYWDVFKYMPYKLENGTIKRDENLNLRERVNTDTIANWSKNLGDDGVFLHKVDDGAGIKRSTMKTYLGKDGLLKYDVEFTKPIINEFISLPGFTNKIKFIEGNNGDFDINNSYKYSYNNLKNPYKTFDPSNVYYAKSGIKIKEKNKGKFTKYCNGKVTQACIDKAKRSGNKKLIKRATFAENSRSWSKKHFLGGVINIIGID